MKEDEFKKLKDRGIRLGYDIEEIIDGTKRSSVMIFEMYVVWQHDLINFAKEINNRDLEVVCKKAYRFNLIHPELATIKYQEPEFLNMKKGVKDMLKALNKISISFETKNIKLTGKNINFIIKIKTGDFTLNKTVGNLNPKGQEYKVLNLLLNAPSLGITFEEGLNIIGKNYSKSNKADLAIIIRNIKTKMNILPRKKTSSKDFFKNQTNIGYRLIGVKLSKN